MVSSPLSAERVKIEEALARWPFLAMRREIARLSLGFDADLPPVFFAGDPWGSAEFLVIGLKPGRNQDDTSGFAAEKANLTTNAELYRETRLQYFLSDGLNRRHYWPIAKQVATLIGEHRPTDLGTFLHRHIVQVEMFPFFAHSNSLQIDDWLRLRAETEAGRTAAIVLDQILRAKPWKAVIVRYAATVRLFKKCYSQFSANNRLTVHGRSIPLIPLEGQSPSFPALQKTAPRRNQATARHLRRDQVGRDAGHELLPEAELGLVKAYGRRWAVAQSFVLGGTTDEILKRAIQFDRSRSAALGIESAANIEGDRYHMASSDSWYPKHFHDLGWNVRLINGVWSVSAPIRP
ncbi:MAG: hypothetical protein AB7J35_09240 [Dehalococcoidia bacterium]